MALIVFSFPHGFPTARDIRKRSEVQHISPLILSSSFPCLICQTQRLREGEHEKEGREKDREQSQAQNRNIKEELSLANFICISAPHKRSLLYIG